MARNAQEQAQFEADELLRANQTQYDPAKHGAGTVQVAAPGSVSELHKVVQGLESRLNRIEDYIMGGRSAQKQKAAPPADPPAPADPDPPADPDKPKSPFAKSA